MGSEKKLDIRQAEALGRQAGRDRYAFRQACRQEQEKA
jgi:hypothetical protein